MNKETFPVSDGVSAVENITLADRKGKTRERDSSFSGTWERLFSATFTQRPVCKEGRSQTRGLAAGTENTSARGGITWDL